MTPAASPRLEHRHRARGADEPRCDAFTTWASATAFRDARPPDREQVEPPALWLLLGLRGEEKGDPPTSWLYQRAAALPSGWLRVPGQYAKPLVGLEAARHCTALASPEFIRFLVDGRAPSGAAGALLREIRARIERYEIGLAAAGWGEAAAQAAPLAPATDPRPPSVIGIVDDGLPFAHDRVCWRDDQGRRRTRFLALWDQASRTPTEPRWCLGRTLLAAEMDDAIKRSTTTGRVDEDAVYHHAGMARLLRHRVTHGAHVLDLAAGAAPPDRPDALPAVVGVQLRPMESTLCITPGAHLFDAIRFVLAQADAACAGRPCPVVVNASVGNIAGPHDGRSLFETAVDELIGLRRTAGAPLEVVLPAGNSHLSRCHAWAELEPGGHLPLAWHVRPDDGTSSYLEAWFFPKGFRDDQPLPPLDLTVTVTPPGGAAPMVVHARGVEPGAHEVVFMRGGDTLAVLGLHPQPANGRYWMALLTVAPTAPYGPWTACAPAGAWMIEIQAGPDTHVYCNVYSQRDDKSFGHKGRGRQAVIEDGHDQRFDGRGAEQLDDPRAPDGTMRSYRRRVGTLNGLANGHEVQVVGGLRAEPDGTLKPARYSSVGIPVEEKWPRKRSHAVTEDSAVLHGVLAMGSRSGTVVALSGTSMAAPQLARALAQGQLGGGPAQVPDFNGDRRVVILPAADLDRRSRRRRGEA